MKFIRLWFIHTCATAILAALPVLFLAICVMPQATRMGAVALWLFISGVKGAASALHRV
jgi:hypothetical protein